MTNARPAIKATPAAAFSPAPAERAHFAKARQAWLDALPVAAAVAQSNGTELAIVAQNAAFARLDDGRPCASLSSRRSQKFLERAGIGTRIHDVLSGASAGERFDWRDGGLIDGRHFTVAVSPLVGYHSGEPRALVTLVDRTSEVQTEQSLRRQMLSDPLTGLANRAGFVEGLELKIADDGVDRHAVLLVDLTRFSRVNECMGSLGGDELIITVARRLNGVVRAHDLLARTAANEFAIALRLDDGPAQITRVAQRVEATLSEPFRLSDFEIKIDCAIGCALATRVDENGTDEDGAHEDAEELIRHAQLALKQSKTSRRVEVYRPAALDAARRRFVIETELRRAIEREDLTLAFQPLVDLPTGRIAGFEALARWHHPDRGRIDPDEFVPIAEDSGLIVPLGRWALDRALRTLAGWDAAAGFTLPLYVGVNLSPIQIARDEVAAPVADALRHHGIAGSRLSIELTESAIIGDPGRAARTLAALKASDAMIAMDDFGTGYSNLASLQRLPIDTLKIDRSFVTDMLDDADRIAIVRAILGLAQALGMTTVAEGVETAELARTLAALGCTTGQGYHFAHGLAADAALAYALGSIGGTN